MRWSVMTSFPPPRWTATNADAVEEDEDEVEVEDHGEGAGEGDQADIFRRVMSRFPTGIAVVTGMRDGVPVGMSANSFTSVSLNPALVLFCAAHASSTWPDIAETGAFAVNILPERSVEVARRFARKGVERFAGVPYRDGVTGSPVLAEALAFLDCQIEHVYEAGDHVIVVGSVIDTGEQSPDRPLVFYSGEYRQLRPIERQDSNSP